MSETNGNEATQFQEGNTLWQLRSKIGRDMIFATPEELWKEAQKYFKATDKRKYWNEKDWVGKNADEVERFKRTPYTLTGLFIYLGVNQFYFNQFKKRNEKKTDEKSTAFALVIYTIEQIIYTQKFEGAAVGAFNANIISRELGLADASKVDVTSQGEKINEPIDWSKVPLEMRKAMLLAIKKEA